MIVFLNGQFIEADKAKVSVFDHGFLYGDGCFETLRTYAGKLFRPKEHLKRLRNSANQMQIDLPWRDAELLEWMQATLERNNYPEARLRITITRGRNEFDFIGARQPTILVVVSKFLSPDKTVFTQGVAVEILEVERILPQVKSLNLLPSLLGQQLKKKEKVFETLFVNRYGYITEGTVSNFFMVKDDIIYTAPSENVLSGITRDLVFEMADRNKIKLQEENFSVQDVLNADEAFLTSTIMDIAPVVCVKEEVVARGKVGHVTRRLMNLFEAALRGW